MYNIGKDQPTYVAADPTQQREVSFASGGTVYYKNEADVDSGDTKLEAGKPVVLTAGAYFISASASKIQVRDLETSTSEDATVVDELVVGGAASVKGKLHAEGEIEIEGDLNHDGTKAGFFGTAPVARPNVKPAAEVTAKELCEALEKLGLIE